MRYDPGILIARTRAEAFEEAAKIVGDFYVHEAGVVAPIADYLRAIADDMRAQIPTPCTDDLRTSVNKIREKLAAVRAMNGDPATFCGGSACTRDNRITDCIEDDGFITVDTNWPDNPTEGGAI
jgi:hypothetical protein